MTTEFPFEHFFKSNNNSQGSDLMAQNVSLDKESTQQSLTDIDLESASLQIFEYLQKNTSPQKYNAYFKNTFQLSSIGGNKIFFSASTPFVKSMVEGLFLQLINEAIIQALGKSFEVIIEVEEITDSLSSNSNNILNSLKNNNSNTEEDNFSSKESSKSVKDVKFTLDLNQTQDDLISSVESKYIDHMSEEPGGYLIDHKKTFDNFIVGSSNNMAFATARAVAKEPSRPGSPGKYPSLYIHSDSGLGKTHLLHAVANGIRENFPSLTICLITARDFMKEMVDHIQANNLHGFQKKYSDKIDVLMIDDIHELKNKQGTQNEFFHIFNELHNKGKQLIFTSDKLPKEIDGITERIRTRLQWGLVIDIQKPDLETRMAILKRKAYELDLYLQDDTFQMIATNIQNSIRELEGSLIKLSAYADVMKVEIDNDIVSELLNFSDRDLDSTPTIESVAKVTSNFYKIPLVDLQSKSRTKHIAQARHIAMYLSQKRANAKLQEIGNFFGGRDHTSVMHGIKKITDVIKNDKNTSREVLQIENSL